MERGSACVCCLIAGRRSTAGGAWRRGCPGALNSRGHHRTKLFEVYGLGQVVKRSRPQGFNGIFSGAVSGHDHAAFAALLVTQVLQDLHAKAVGQAHVRNHHIKEAALELFACFLHGRCGFHAVALAQQSQFIQGAQVGLVVNDQDGGGGSVHGSQITIESKSVAGSTGRVVRRNATVNALPPTFPRAVSRVVRW